MRRLPLVLAGLSAAAVMAYVATVVLRPGDVAPPRSNEPPPAPSRTATPAAPPTPFPPDGKTFLGLQTAAGVPLQCDEGADFMTFRVGLFGLEKWQNVDRTVAQLAEALDRIGLGAAPAKAQPQPATA